MSPQGWKGVGEKTGWFPLLVSTLVSSHWSSEILTHKLDDKLTGSGEHTHTTSTWQKQTIPSEADKATRQVGAGPPLLCFRGVSVFVRVCVFVYVGFCLTVHLCMCLGEGSRWTTGHCCELWEFDRVIQSPLTLLPSLTDWGFQFSREAGEKRYKAWTSAPLPLLSPCPPCFETKYAHTLMISVYLL